MEEKIITLNNYYNLKLVKEERKQGSVIIVEPMHKTFVKAIVKGCPDDNVLNLSVGDIVMIDPKFGQHLDEENLVIKKDYIIAMLK